MKVCTKCGESKSLTEFSKHRNGLRAYCKHCAAIANSKWYAANSDYHRKWRVENPDKVKVAAVKYRTANPEKERARHSKWKLENPEYNRVHCHNRRARKRETGGKLSSGLADKLFKFQRGKCACGCKQPLGTNYHLDHIMPIALGGMNTDDNIQLLRSTCNQRKYKRHPVEFMQSRGFLL